MADNPDPIPPPPKSPSYPPGNCPRMTTSRVLAVYALVIVCITVLCTLGRLSGSEFLNFVQVSFPIVFALKVGTEQIAPAIAYRRNGNGNGNGGSP